MRKFENDCVSCDLPCIDCGRKHVEHVYCDNCGEDLTSDLDGVVYEGKDFCYSCAKELLIKKFYPSGKQKRDFYRYSPYQINDKEFILNLDDKDNEEMYRVMMEEDFETIAEDCGVNWTQIELEGDIYGYYL